MKNKPNPQQTPIFFLGIDVGKRELFCHLLGENEPLSYTFENSAEGISALLTWLEKHTLSSQISACLEQTGHYGYALAKGLHQLNIQSLFLVNPRQIKAFGNQKLRRNKSDTADARLIAAFLKAEHLELQPWEPKTPELEQLTELSRYAESITREIAKLKTKCEAAQNAPILRSLKRRLKFAEKELADIRKRLNLIIAKSTPIKVQSDLLRSIPGLGEITTHLLLAELPDLTHFSSARQLAAWAGLTPRHFVSGTSGRSTTPITKVGSAALRRSLFLPAMNARVFNPLLKSFGDRLKENGKKPKQIIIAIMRKLLHQIYGILKSGQPYNPEKQGYVTSPQPA